MLVENINTTLTGNNEKNEPYDKGWGTLEQGAIALVALFVIVVTLGSLYALRIRTNVTTEAASIQTIIISAQSLLKGSSGYASVSSAKMVGTLVQMGTVPPGMTIQGDKTSDTAALYDVWGGTVIVAPASTSGFNNDFTITYGKALQDVCTQITTRISKTGLANGTTLSSTAHSDRKVITEEAGTQCKADNGSTGTNKLVFIING